jgi:hypothetical protein
MFKTSAQVHIPSQMFLAHTPSNFFEIYFYIINLYLRLSNGPFPHVYRPEFCMHLHSVPCRIHAPLFILLYVIIFIKFYLPQLNNIKVVQLEMMSNQAGTENYISGKVTLYYLCVNVFRNRNFILSTRISRKSRSYTFMLQF